MLNCRELIFSEYFFNQCLVSQIAPDADQIVVPVLIVDQVNADAPVSRCEHSALEYAAKETCATGNQYVLQSNFLASTHRVYCMRVSQAEENCKAEPKP
jgi:hypothetical protein